MSGVGDGLHAPILLPLSAIRVTMPSGEMLALMFGGRYPDGRVFVTGELIAGGSGAGLRSDGVDGHCHGKMVEAAVRRSRADGSSRGRVLPMLCGVGPEQTHGAAGE